MRLPPRLVQRDFFDSSTMNKGGRLHEPEIDRARLSNEVSVFSAWYVRYRGEHYDRVLRRVIIATGETQPSQADVGRPTKARAHSILTELSSGWSPDSRFRASLRASTRDRERHGSPPCSRHFVFLSIFLCFCTETLKQNCTHGDFDRQDLWLLHPI